MRLSKDFKEKLLEPIDELFKQAQDDMGPVPESGGRNWRIPNPFGGIPAPGMPAEKPRQKKVKLGTVDEKALAQAMTELNSMIGLNSVKASIERLTKYARIESERRCLKLPPTGITFHTVFSGSPGTGKTSVARVLGKILKALGLLQHGHTVEVSKQSLCGAYLGQTPHMVKDAFDEADGGVLFIDEAYSLVAGNEDMYGREAIDAIVKLMEDRRDRVVVVVAGYVTEMHKFVNSNPGLRSRFTRDIYFPDYTAEELQLILKRMYQSTGFEVTDGFLLRSELLWDSLYKKRLTADANGRMVRNAFEFILENQAIRLTKLRRTEPQELCQLLPQDLDFIEERLIENSHD